MARPTLKKQIPNLQEAIKETAWKQIAELGAAVLSLRAIARELNITAPAIYNYFPSRDDLVTALIVDAFTSLTESQKSALEAGKGNDAAENLISLGIAYRSWAATYPQRYQLIFGTPIPNYEAPDDATLQPAAWALMPLIQVIQTLFVEGRLRLESLDSISKKLKPMLENWKAFVGGGFDIEVLYLAFIVWSRVHGLVMLELGHQIPAFVTDPGEVFNREASSIRLQYVK